MAVESAGADTGGPRDLIEAGAGALFRESGLRRFEQADAVALAHRLAACGRQRVRPHRPRRKHPLINGECLRI